jgi:hypothetical protein
LLLLLSCHYSERLSTKILNYRPIYINLKKCTFLNHAIGSSGGLREVVFVGEGDLPADRREGIAAVDGCVANWAKVLRSTMGSTLAASGSQGAKPQTSRGMGQKKDHNTIYRPTVYNGNKSFLTGMAQVCSVNVCSPSGTAYKHPGTW